MTVQLGRGNLNNTLPAAPAGSVNVTFQLDDSVDPGNISAYVAQPTNNGVLGIVIDGGGAVPSTGSKGYLRAPYDCTIVSWTMLANTVGSAQITVKKCAYASFPTTASIVASAPPAIVSAQNAASSTLTGWTTSVSKGDVLEFNLDSITTIGRVILELQVTRSD
jgi:hypothetical protein